MPAFYRRHFSGFLNDHVDQITGRLTNEAAGAGFYQQVHSQTIAWHTQVALLKDCVERLCDEFEAGAWELLLEYPIPRRGKRIDAVILADTVIVVLEFKCGAREFGSDAIAQVEDYCLDLGDFHRESFGRKLIPFLVATEAASRPQSHVIDSETVQSTWLTNSVDFPTLLAESLRLHRDAESPPIDPVRWDESDYAPTPTIIEAAQALYAGQNVNEISRCHSGIENLTRTTEAIISAVDDARSKRRKLICFITGVPGAGKTLAGLNIVHNKKLHDGDLGVFLSGNGPLVRVLTEALARDAAFRLAQPLAQSRRKVEAFIQNVHRFIDHYFADPGKIPVDKVVVFDEAQRAWDAAQSKRKFNRDHSEPEILLEIMNRQEDWAVIVALVGGGQEINRGEAGLSEWGRAIASKFPH